MDSCEWHLTDGEKEELLKKQRGNNSALITLLAGYLVEWDDDEGPNDIFFRKEEWANCRAEEVRAGGFKSVTVTPLYKQVAS